MEKYLVIITTILVLTQIIRLIQNSIQLKHLENKSAKEDCIADKWDRMSESIEKLIEKIENIDK